MRKIFLIAGLISIASTTLFAQNEKDLLQFSQPTLGGSARYIGLGGAFKALGGDLSALENNVAGTGVFNSSEFSIGLGVNSTTNSTNYLGNTVDGSGGKVNISNLGYVWHRGPRSESDVWKSINFAYTYNRANDFNTYTSMRGVNTRSLSDDFAQKISGVPYFDDDLYNAGPFDTYLAYQVGLIEADSANPYEYFSNIYGNVKQSIRIDQKGKIGNNQFSFGANYNNKLYFGIGLSANSISLSKEETISEATDSLNSYIRSFSYTYNLNTVGTAYNLKLGIIYRVADALRVGVSYQSPTMNRLTDTFDSELFVSYYEGTTNTIFSEEIGKASYKSITPSRLGFGVAYVTGKIGLISADFERCDYSNGEFKNRTSWDKDAPKYDFSAVNSAISQRLQASNSIRLGTEWKILQLSLRAGYGITQMAFKNNFATNYSNSNTVSFGLGYKYYNNYFDLGLANTKYTSNYSPLIINPEQYANAKINSSVNLISLSYSYRF